MPYITKVSFRCLHYFLPAMLVSYGGTTWRLYTGLCKFVQNIPTNIWSLRRRTDLKFGEMSYLFIFYNIMISWLYTCTEWFSNYFFIAWQCIPRINRTLSGAINFLSAVLADRQNQVFLPLYLLQWLQNNPARFSLWFSIAFEIHKRKEKAKPSGRWGQNVSNADAMFFFSLA